MADLVALSGRDSVILLPTLNEERGLPVTLDDIPLAQLRARGWSAIPVVIDGGSTDRTREVAFSRGVPLVDQKSRGKGAAIREGLELLDRLGVRFAVVLDADATYPGSAVLPALELLDSGCDLVVGVRHPEGGHPRSFRDLVHRTGNVLLNFAAGQYSRSTYLDLTSGFWAINVRKSRELRLITDNFGIEAELFLKAHRYGWDTSQIPIEYRKRVGVAKLHAVPDGTRILLSILRFGRRSLQAAPPTISEAPGILRELLLAAFIGGYHDVELLCPPALQREANTIADRLRRSGLAPRVVIRENPVATSGAMLGPGSPTVIPAVGGVGGGISTRFGPQGSRLQVQLVDSHPAAEPLGLPADKLDGSRSGAFATRKPRSHADLLDPLRLMGQGLNGSPAAQRRRLFSANGIKVLDVPENDVDAGAELRSGPAIHAP